MPLRRILPAVALGVVVAIPSIAPAYAEPTPVRSNTALPATTASIPPTSSADPAPNQSAAEKKITPYEPSSAPPRESASESPSAAPGTQSPRDPQVAAVEDFWTPERMAAARPVTEQEARDAKLPPKARDALRSPSHPFEGIPQVGTFFYESDGDYRFCVGTVVTSPGKNMVASAAHCFDSNDRKRNLVFVPQHHVKVPAPHGKFVIKTGSTYMYPSYLSRGANAADDLDFAFLKTESRSDGKKLQDVVGSVPLSLNSGFTHATTRVIGYPYLPGDDKYKPKQNPLDCTTAMTKFTTGDKIVNGKRWKGGAFPEIHCDGYVAGTSGSPFLIPASGGAGYGLAGVTGGWLTGGQNANISYSSYFDNDVKRLFDAAVEGHQPADPSDVLPKAATWTHAKDIASGYFTLPGAVEDDAMDMFVMWSDGELTLYRGAGPDKNYFDKEFRVQPANKFWADHAVQVTAGDFTGDNGSDLVVQWNDGEVTLYPSVDEKGFHGEQQLMPANATWTHATEITAGRYGGNQWQDDLVVRWSDGELTVYQNTSTKLGKEIQAVDPKKNPLWKHATEIGSGDYTGNDTWDLIVRWSDGELTNYRDFTGDPTDWKESKLHGPDKTWEHALIVTGGDFSDNPHPDDTIVRWSDGELTLYTEGNATDIGQENRLVAPPNGFSAPRAVPSGAPSPDHTFRS